MNVDIKAKKRKHRKKKTKRKNEDDVRRKIEESRTNVSEADLLGALGKRPQRREKRTLLGDDDVFIVQDFLTKKECRNTIELCERAGFVLTDQKGTRYMARRRNGRIQINAPALAETLWTRCRSFFPERIASGAKVIGLSSNFRFYKYEKGDRFGMHVDESVDHGGGARSMFTLLVYLNASPDVRGGATVFYKGSKPTKATELLRFLPQEGVALAHIHGPRCMLHEGAVVEDGCKYLMRTDVVYSYGH